MTYQPFIIIGAPRSGTNMLRDSLNMLPGVGTWPCDEINYIWRHGNVRYPSDEFSANMANAKVQYFIKRKFDSFAKSNDLDVLVEKTCANSLRAGFVDNVIPNAKYVFIVRDGIDAVGSALERWKASFDFSYTMKKARFVPIADVPYYGTRYFFNHLYRLLSREKHLAFWGPAMDDIDVLLARHSLIEVCALQWQRCVENAERDFAAIPTGNIIRIRYEEFVNNPVSEFSKISEFIGKPVPASVNAYLAENISDQSVGKGRQALGEECIAQLRPLIADTLDRFGYE